MKPLDQPPGETEADLALRRCLERRFGAAGGIRRESFSGLTSFRLEDLTVEILRQYGIEKPAYMAGSTVLE